MKCSDEYLAIENLWRDFFHLLGEYNKNNDGFIISDLLNILNSSDVVWHILPYIKENIIKEIFPAILKFAVEGYSGQIGFAQDLIFKLDDDFIKNNLSKCINLMVNTYRDNDEYLDYYFLNVVVLYRHFNLNKDLKIFLENSCRKSNNPDVNEIYNDFISSVDKS